MEVNPNEYQYEDKNVFYVIINIESLYCIFSSVFICHLLKYCSNFEAFFDPKV